MKKFLSFLLAVFMIVSVMVPMLTFLVSAEGSVDESADIVSEYPELVITEVHSNAVTGVDIYNHLVGGNATDESKFLASTMFTRSDSQDTHFAPVYVAAGASVSGLYVKNTDWVTSAVTFDAASGNAVEGVHYYRRYDYNSLDSNECVEFIEIYNSGSEPVNLYDYQIAKDYGAFERGGTPVYVDLYGGTLASAAHGQYFKRAGNITEFEEGVVYYTKSNATTYVPANMNVAPDASMTYYYEVEEGAFVENPSEEEGAWLQPGQVAVLWNYNQRAWKAQLTAEIFQAYYSTRYAYGQNWDEILFLGMDGNSSGDRYYPQNHNNGKASDLWQGSYIYGIVHDSVVNSTPDEIYREDLWTSWVLCSYYLGIPYSDSFVLQETVIGVTKVVDQGFLVYDQTIDEYVPVSQSGGTADKNGKAVAGVQYYKPSVSESWKNGSSSRSVNFLYGLDASGNMKEGRAYTLNSSTLSPGLLDNIQTAVLPNYSKNVDALNKTPGIVITEVVPDNGTSDAYEYVEVVNTSGAPLNIFDYSFVAHPDNFQGYFDQFFNKILPIIPGEYGSILASSGVTKYQDGYVDLAPTNVTYQNGWLQPGEAAVLWAFTADSYAEQATFARFRAHYDIDENVKVFAMDADGTNTRTGRPQRQDLQDIGLMMFGLVANNKLIWANNMYTSDPILQPITYSSGKTHSTNRGISINDCESFVLCAPLHVVFQNVSIGTDYGYQYVWRNIQGGTNKCGAYLRMSYTTNTGGSDFSGTGSVVTDVWKASPGRLIAEQKTDMIVDATKDRYVVYMQDFNGYGTVTGYEAVAEKLGLSGVLANTALNDAHNANIEATESVGTSFLEIRNGKLYINNKGNADDYMTLMSDDVLGLLDDQNFTIEYSMTYDANSINNQNGYSGILYNFDASNMTYGASIVRVSGYGNNAVSLGGNLIDIDDGEGNANSIATKSLTGVPTLYERLYGDMDSISGFYETLDGSVMLAGKPITVRIDVDRENGVTVTVNDVIVSSTAVAGEEGAAQWKQFVDTANGTDLVLMTSENISVSYDYITVYTDGDMIRSANEGLYGNGFMITEFHSENATFKSMEITNVSDVAMNLYDCMIVTTSTQTTNGALQTWNRAIKLYSDSPVSSYDSQYKNLKHISNPSSCMVQPGESVVVWILSDIESHADENGRVTINTNDFRNYYKELGNEKLTEVDEKGNAVVKVVVAYDQSESDNYLAYGLTKKTNFYSAIHNPYFSNVFSAITPQSDAEYSLGYVSQDKYALVAALSFTNMGEIVEKDDEGNVTNVINVYAHQSILNGLTDAGVENTSASVNASNTGASVSFRAAIDAAYYNRMVELFGEDNITYGILIARADSAMKANTMRPYLLDAADVSYINDNEDLRIVATSTRRSVYGNSHAVDAGFYSITYSAMAYMTIETQAFGAITKYAESAYHQSVKQIAATAMVQYVDTATAKAEMAANPAVKYYEISAGQWSLYTREQIARLDVLCK